MGVSDQALSLNLGLTTTDTTTSTSAAATATHYRQKRKSTDDFDPSLTLSLSAGARDDETPATSAVAAASLVMISGTSVPEKPNYKNLDGVRSGRQSSGSRSSGGASSLSTVKREREEEDDDEDETAAVAAERSWRAVRGSAAAAAGVSEEDEDEDEHSNGTANNNHVIGGGGGGGGGGGVRKKLRLSKDQSALLEESFKQHSTLSPKQKQALANQLNLRPRQVEVWFQNRRARTKLKQTEMDCEYLKKCCESLTEENRRLHKELQELRAFHKHSTSPASQLYMPAATLSLCPSCDRLGSNGNGNGNGGGGVVGSAAAVGGPKMAGGGFAVVGPKSHLLAYPLPFGVGVGGATTNASHPSTGTAC